jgi:competence protein ComEC
MAPTFQAQPIALERVCLDRQAEAINAQLVALSRSAAPDCLIGGNITTLAAYLESWDEVNFDRMVENYRRQIRGLIDGGADFLAAETLLSRGVFSLDGLIVTHYDTDHAGGVEYFMTRMPVKQVYLPPTEDNSYKPGIESVATYAVPITQDTQISWADCKLIIFSPVLSSSDNESGICVLFESETYDILITGDLSTLGEMLLLTQKQLPDVDILVVGHHGSKHSTSEQLLEAVKPEYAFISVGKGNSYGHPADETLRRLEDYECIIKRTDLDGHIHFRR